MKENNSNAKLTNEEYLEAYSVDSKLVKKFIDKKKIAASEQKRHTL